MRMPWNKSTVEQLDLVDTANEDPIAALIQAAGEGVADARTPTSAGVLSLDALVTEGVPLLVSVDCLDEDPGNPILVV